ncbi:hypothetical protein LUZ61_007639 [Rhynchospora tenuis]|uniref:GRAS family transcription factor n=1 Tax=Rhynchospora tenuis TaxID=198213 RepID=A0AAD5ZU22_9POAL|nr:hypothetical protein LUZ61_007639 [Rhynchospora tenuis]
MQQEVRNNSWEQHEDKHSTEEIRENDTEKNLVDLKSLLIYCSEAVSTNDYNRTCELISQIRKHSSPKGDCYQRLAYYLVDGLEARLAGTGSDIYREMLSRRGNTTDILKASRYYHAICPFLRTWYYFSNQTILNVSKGATKVHIIDFGIQWGFMWPSFFERLSSLGNTAPKIRITGIGFPERGFRPGKLIEETGRRLSEYAHRFNIHFKYQGIASKWENITIEDLKIDKDEVLVVNCILGLKNIADETIARNNPRDKVLRLIKDIKPCVFIHGILNASYGTPFFTTRFKEVLSRFFTFFDIYEATMPRESEMRIYLERNIIIPCAINAIACEGSERVERPETYRQWQARTLRAGFMQLPVESMIMRKIENYVKELYHKEYFVDEDRKWLLLGWKGTTWYALSTWKPNDYEC